MMAFSLEVGASPSLADLELLLADLPSIGGADDFARLVICMGREPDILVDVWTAILCGTLCRRAATQVVAGRQEEAAELRFATSLPGLVSLSMAHSVRSDAGAVLDTATRKQSLMLENEGLVSPDSDVSQTLVEFDPDYPVSPLLQRSDWRNASPRLRRRLFENQVLQFRQMLDFGSLRRGGGPVRGGPAGYLGRFLAELHENGYEHGSRGHSGSQNGTRFLRIRTHAAADPVELVERCGRFRQLRSYVERSFTGTEPVTLIEACISDFGLGIVDGFQASPAGVDPNVDRRELLDGLIYGRLTSKSNDPSAGLGIQKALDAAKSMQAFVSLRTAEFWMAVSFLSDKPDARLVHLGPAPHPEVTGTHWQIFWPHHH